MYRLIDWLIAMVTNKNMLNQNSTYQHWKRFDNDAHGDQFAGNRIEVLVADVQTFELDLQVPHDTADQLVNEGKIVRHIWIHWYTQIHNILCSRFVSWTEEYTIHATTLLPLTSRVNILNEQAMVRLWQIPYYNSLTRTRETCEKYTVKDSKIKNLRRPQMDYFLEGKRKSQLNVKQYFESICKIPNIYGRPERTIKNADTIDSQLERSWKHRSQIDN